MGDLVYSSILVELDALLDTRAATLFRLNPDYLGEALSKDYYTRTVDKFPNVDNDKYNDLYQKRNKETLRQSLITDIGRLLDEFCKNILDNTIKTPFHYSPKVILNVYPYELEESEINVLIAGIVSITNRLTEVEVVNLSYEQLTPTYVKSKLSALVLYDYWRWLDIHSVNGGFKKVSCPEVALIGPRISFNEDLSKLKLETDPFDAAVELAKPFIALSLIDVAHFCLSIKYLDKKENKP